MASSNEYPYKVTRSRWPLYAYAAFWLLIGGVIMQYDSIDWRLVAATFWMSGLGAGCLLWEPIAITAQNGWNRAMQGWHEAMGESDD